MMGRRPRFSNHTGLTERVRVELRREPLSINRLAERLGEHPAKVKGSIQQLCERLGGFAPVPWTPRSARLYASVEWIRANDPRREERGGSGEIAGPILIGRGFRWWVELA